MDGSPLPQQQLTLIQENTQLLPAQVLPPPHFPFPQLSGTPCYYFATHGRVHEWAVSTVALDLGFAGTFEWSTNEEIYWLAEELMEESGNFVHGSIQDDEDGNELGASAVKTLPYHPQGNGLIESSNRTLLQGLRKLVHSRE